MKALKALLYAIVCLAIGIMAGQAFGLALGTVVGFDKQIDSLEASYERRAISAYKAGYFDGARTVDFLNFTDSLTAEKFDEHFKADSVNYQRLWIGTKQ